MTTSRIGPGVPTGGQFSANAHSESGVSLTPPTPRVPTDREILDSIAVLMAESPDWDADMTDVIGNEIARSGRPHPGETIFTDAEVELIEARGDSFDEANGRAYQAKMYAKRAAAAAVPMRVDPADTMALLNAHAARAEEANQAVELTAAKALAQMAKREWPNASYLKFDVSDHNGRMNPAAVLDEDFNEIATDFYSARTVSGYEFHKITEHLTPEGTWTGFREYSPEDDDEWEPCLGLNEIVNLDLETVGAGPAPRAPEPAETFYTGQESKVTGHFGNVTFSPRDGEPGTIIMVDTSGNRSGEPLVVIINDHVIDIAQ